MDFDLWKLVRDGSTIVVTHALLAAAVKHSALLGDFLDLVVERGEIFGFLGHNGAGKTTIFNLITGVIRADTGKVMFDRRDITGKKPHKIASYGIGRTFQITPLFSDFTTLENVVASCYLHPRSSFWNILFNTRAYQGNEAYALEESNKILNLTGLIKVKSELAKNLPHGYQKMLGIARALAVQPRLLMLDEPLGGMNDDEIAFTMGIIEKMRRKGMTILVIEHNMQILDLCDRVVVINFGQIICDGCVEDVKSHPDVIKAYLGE
jgi:branched-chain amino acid transport system ATP-binding protein